MNPVKREEDGADYEVPLLSSPAVTRNEPTSAATVTGNVIATTNDQAPIRESINEIKSKLDVMMDQINKINAAVFNDKVKNEEPASFSQGNPKVGSDSEPSNDKLAHKKVTGSVSHSQPKKEHLDDTKVNGNEKKEPEIIELLDSSDSESEVPREEVDHDSWGGSKKKPALKSATLSCDKIMKKKHEVKGEGHVHTKKSVYLQNEQIGTKKQVGGDNMKKKAANTNGEGEEDTCSKKNMSLQDKQIGAKKQVGDDNRKKKAPNFKSEDRTKSKKSMSLHDKQIGAKKQVEGGNKKEKALTTLPEKTLPSIQNQENDSYVDDEDQPIERKDISHDQGKNIAEKKEQHKKVAMKAARKCANASSGTKKTRRHRPGTKAIREIAKYQKTTDTVIPKASFNPVVGELSKDFKKDLHWKLPAMAATQEVAENHVVGLMNDANHIAIHDNRVTPKPKDVKLAQLIREKNKNY